MSKSKDKSDDFYETRTSSAGYRFPVYKRPQTAAAAARDTQQSAYQSSGRKSVPPPPHEPLDPLQDDRIRTETIANEKRRNAIWKSQWGFVTQFDPLGREKPVKELPRERTSAYSATVPNTDSGQYGSRVSTPVGQRLQSFEYRFYSGNRKRALGSEFICG